MSQRANITLKISADEAQAVRAFLDLGAAERDLEIETRKADLALKRMSATQARAAATAKTAADAETALAARQRATAASSLSAQKSAALLSQMREKAAREQRMATGWESAAARAMMDADVANQRRVKKRAEESAAAMERQRQGFRRGVGDAMAFAGSLTGIVSGVALVTGALRELSAAQEHAIGQAKRGNELAAGVKELVLALPRGTEGEAMKMDILSAGAQHGLSPEQSSTLAAPLYSAADKDGSGSLSEEERANFDANFQAGAQLQSVGVEAGDATNVLLAGDNQGEDGATTGAKLLEAAAIGKRGPKEFSMSASAIGQYDSLDTGLAVATAISNSELNAGRIPERVKDIQMALSSAQDKSDFSVQHGLAGLSQSEKIHRLRALAVASGNVKSFSDEFINQGLDEGKASSLAMLVQQADVYDTTEKAMRSVNPEDLGTSIAALRASDPAVRSQMEQAETRAITEFDTMYGEGAEENRETLARAQARGLKLRRYGGDRAVNEDGTAKTNLLEWDTWAGSIAAAWNGMPGTGLRRDPIMDDPSLSWEEKRDKQQELLDDAILERHREALDRNTAALEANSSATQQNSDRTKQSRPVGGSPANAEEKY